jgi:calcineurin-like phosphoesterase family protein
MGEAFFTADHHFGHANIIKYCNRPFSTVEEMDEFYIKQWNSMVSDKDTVYYLGDFTLNSDASSYIVRLNGRKIIVIPGGHDKRWCRNCYNKRVEIEDSIVRYNSKLIICHYPIEEWEGKHHGVVHIHGHSHGNGRKIEGRFDIGIDVVGRPITYSEIEENV